MNFWNFNCNCKDANGKPKKLYNGRHEAEEIAKVRSSQANIHLSVYKCPYSDGWHLTKSNGGRFGGYYV